ncbi:MAG: hypothetical protein ABIH41_04340, partial [Nanoarchaeota archaeon]
MHNDLEAGLKESYEAATRLIERNSNEDSSLVDICCVARPPTRFFVDRGAQVVGIQPDAQARVEAHCALGHHKNFYLLGDDPAHLSLPDAFVNVTYALDNLIGNVPLEYRNHLMSEMSRITSNAGKVITFTWKADTTTTAFLREWYGQKTIRITTEHIETATGTCLRIPAAHHIALHQR